MVHIRKMFATFLMFGRSFSLGSLTKCLFHVFLYLHYQKTDRFNEVRKIIDPPIFLVLYCLLEMVGGGAPLCFDLV